MNPSRALPSRVNPSRPLRICLASQEYPDEIIGGIGTYTRNMARALADAGHEVFVVARSNTVPRCYKDGPVTVYKIAPGILKHALVRRYADNLTYSLALARKLWKLCRTHAIDLVEMPEWAAEGFVYGLLRPRPAPMIVRLHTPLRVVKEVNQAHRSWPGSTFVRFLCWMERRAILCADLLTAPSRAMAVYCREALRLGARPIHVYPNPVDTELFQPAAEGRRDHSMVLYVGQLAKRKGVAVFREVIPAVLRNVPNARFVFVGRDGSFGTRGGLMSELIRANIPKATESHVSFLGEKPWAQLAGYYRKANVCVLPSLFECFGLACAESMASGCIVIGSKNGGMAEIITDARDGFLVDPTDAQAIAGRITDCLRRDEPCLRARARDKAVDLFSLPRVARMAVKVYQIAKLSEQTAEIASPRSATHTAIPRPQ